MYQHKHICTDNIPISNIWLNPAQHVDGGLVNLQEDFIEDLQNKNNLAQ
jgi:hypothetical protein